MQLKPRTYTAILFVALALALGLFAATAASAQQLTWKTGDPILIMVDRPACDQNCPSYSITIDQSGSVKYSGRENVLVLGDHSAHLQPKQIQQIVRAFQSAHFNALPQISATPSATSNPQTVVTLKLGATAHSSAGDAVGPLANTIDQITQSDRWTRGSDQTIPSLQVDCWNFRAADPEHAALLTQAAAVGNATIIAAILAQGSPINAKDKSGNTAIFPAISGHHVEALQALLAAHPDLTIKNPDGESALAMAQELGYDDLAILLKNAGATD